MAQRTDTEKPKRASRLGRGLSSLMSRPVAITPPPEFSPEPPPEAAPKSAPKASAERPAFREGAFAAEEPSQPASAQAEQADVILYLPIEAVCPNRHQPRQRFAESTLQQLADSIKSEGLIQPIVVRPVRPEKGGTTDGKTHELVAGERRWRAAKIAGLSALPAIVRPLDDRQVAEWALIENLQREDLNPIERAQAFQHLIDLFALSHDQIASRVGIERSTVSNLLRLLTLDEDVRQFVRDGRLSMGQARALAAVIDAKLQRSLANQAIRQEWSVRKLELAVKQATAAPTLTAAPASAPQRSIHLRDLEQQIGQQLATKVRIRPGRKKGAGTLSIDFYSLDQFDTILASLGVKTE